MPAAPCPIVPTPKQIDLTPGHRPWPARVNTTGDLPPELRAVFTTTSTGHTGRSATDEPPLIARLRVEPNRAGEYALDFSTDADGASAVNVRAGDAAGFRHAAQTLRQMSGGTVPAAGRIVDWPRLTVRGFHLNLESYRRMDAVEAVRLVETAARFKLNTILVEYGSRLPFGRNHDLRDSLALHERDVVELRDVAAANGVQLIPLQQSLAHLDYLLRHDRHAHLRERPDRSNLLCPSHPQSLPLIQSLIDDVLELHPGATLLHVGGDEARKIGQCSRCRALADPVGRGTLFGRHIGAICRGLLERGVRPIVWDDTICAHPSALEHLPRETIIQYWDYIAVDDPTPVLIPRMAHAAGGPRVVHDWRWALSRKRGRISDVQAEVMRHYSQAARLPAALGAEFIREFGRYLGPGFPRWMRALPYLEYYQERGHEVITSPTGMGNGDASDGAPNFRRFEANIRAHARRCIANGRALGGITTVWYDMPPEMLMHPLLQTAQATW